MWLLGSISAWLRVRLIFGVINVEIYCDEDDEDYPMRSRDDIPGNINLFIQSDSAQAEMYSGHEGMAC